MRRLVADKQPKTYRSCLAIPDFGRASPDLGDMLNKELGTDVQEHMQSGKQLLSPPGTEWHHPDGESVELMRKGEHKNPRLQKLLHPGGKGGYARSK